MLTELKLKLVDKREIKRTSLNPKKEHFQLTKRYSIDYNYLSVVTLSGPLSANETISL